MDFSKSSIAKLAGSSNYQVWAIKMKSYLIAQDLWEVIQLKASTHTNSNIKSLNSKVISLIILACEDHVIKLLDPDDLAAIAWKKLEQQYGHIGFSARHLAFQSLVSTNISSCESVDHFIDQFRTNMNTLSQMTTSTLPQWLLLSIFINNVSSKYEAWTQSVMQQVRSKSISEESRSYLDEVIASLIDEARRTNSNSENENTALAARKPAKSKPICRYCGKIHKSENCWQEFPEKKPSARLTTTTTSDNRSQDSSSYPLQNVAFLSQMNNKQSDIWILDSGATQHMCNNKELFVRIEPYNATITTANNSKMFATGRGEVKLITHKGIAFSLINVLYVPKLASNLLSISFATRNPQMRFNFGHGECQIMFGNTLLATAKQHDSLLVLETVKNFAYSTKTTTSLTWHKRLGHLNEEYMTKNSLKALVGPITKFTCESCLKNKSTRNISRKIPVRAKRPLEKVHSDLAGPITPTSLGGSKYVITFTDDYSRFSWVFPCDAKSKVLEIFKSFKKAVETELSQKMAFLHCDNGGEFSSNEFKRFARQEGLQIQYTVPYTPEQNGVAERLNRTLFNTARCLLNESPNLIKPLWAELVRTACYLKNRVPTSSNENFKSPFEILFHRQPSMNHLRIIGSTCYNHKTGKIAGKLDERSTECVLVGYESENIFRIYDSSTRRVVRSRDIVVVEPNDVHQQQFVPIREINHSVSPMKVEIDVPTVTDQIEQAEQRVNSESSSPSLRSDEDPSDIPDPFMAESSRQLGSPIYLENDVSDNSIDELADPRYDSYYNHPKAFITQCLLAADSENDNLPETLEQAMSSAESLQWGESMCDEMRSILENNTWKLVLRPNNGAKVIQGRWVFRTKTDVNGKLIKYKSRWVVRGFQQEEGANFTDTFASVVKPMSYKILFSIAATQNLEVEQMDVKTAFLNSPINDTVYVEQPHGFEVSTEAEESKLKAELLSIQKDQNFAYPKSKRSNIRLVCKLERALYGLKQAPRAWYETLSEFMKKCNLTALRSDYAVFGNSDRSILVAVYVDDLLIFGKDKNKIQNLKNHLHQRFQMSDMGNAHHYLGMQIRRDRNARIIFLDQEKYIRIILERFNMLDCNAVSTPMETGLKLSKRADTATPQEINQYQKLMGCLEYAAIATRPDITFSVHRLAQFASNPDTIHYNAAKRILRYLKGTSKFSLVFKGNQEEKFELFGYSDADWAGSTEDRKSISGYCFYLNHSLISHMSKKQKTIALSTAESETHAAVQATKEAIWLRNILEELGFRQSGATTLYCDNQAAIALSHNPEYHSRSKHVDIQYHFLRQHVEMKTVSLKFVRSEEMAADGLTKALSRPKHDQFCKFMQGELHLI